MWTGKKYSECTHENCTETLKNEGYPICDECDKNQYNGEVKYVKIDDEKHYFINTCGKCGDETGNKYEEGHFIYNPEGQCACGHQVISEPSDDNNGSGDSSNDGNSELINCPFCGLNGQYYEWYTPYADYHVLLKYYGCCYKSIEDDSTKAEHDFSEGRCTECGYQEDGPICEHADCDRATDGTESGTCSRCGSCVTYIISSNADTHTYVYKCNGCGSILEDIGTVTEAHKFYGNIYCVLCGYYNSKPSGNVAEESTPSMTEEEIAQMKAEEITLATEAVIQAEVAIPVTDFVSAEDVNALPAEVKDSTGDEAVYNLSKITTTRGFVAAVEKMVEANKSSVQKKDTVVFYTSAPIAFNTSSLTALSNAATEFVYMFKHEGHLYKVTIPAGAKVDLAGQRFAGPLYIGAQLGTSVLVK